jgi:H+/Cl- antiporter ClcA
MNRLRAGLSSSLSARWVRKPRAAIKRTLRRMRAEPPAGSTHGDGHTGDGEPDVLRGLGQQIAVTDLWYDRGIVLAFAVLTGAAVVLLTLLAELAIYLFHGITAATPAGPLLALVWTPALTAGIVWWTRRYAPMAGGSGIPQVMRAIERDMPRNQREWLVSPILAVHKTFLVAAGLLAGLSIGREGPTVQVGAGLMVGAKRWLSKRSTVDEHDLMVAGAAAGIAAAFNTPLGGIVFSLEELTKRRGITHSSLVISAIVLAGLVAVASFGNETYFGRLSVQSLSMALWWPGLVVAVASGLAGGLFSRLVVASIRGASSDRFTRWRRQSPIWFAAFCGLMVALIGLVTGGQTAGAGYAPTRALLEGEADLPGVYTVLKFCATWLSTWSGAPAGVFAPSLAIGAGIGHDVASFANLGQEAAIPLIALGMVGFLAAVTQAPITAFIIVMEMVSGQAMVLSLMASAMIAAGVSRLMSNPMYTQLASFLPVPAAAPANDEDGSSTKPQPARGPDTAPGADTPKT